MTTVGAFLAALGEQIPFDKSASWDPSPLQLGDPAAGVERVAVCHEVTEEVVGAIEADPVDLLVTYHPLLFRPTNRITAGRSPSGRAFRLIKAGVAVATVHTAFDAAKGGTADALADAIGLEGATGFGPMTPLPQVKVVTFVPPDAVPAVEAAMVGAGAGTIGNYTACSFRSEGIGSFTAGPGSMPTIGDIGGSVSEAEIRIEMICAARAVDRVASALVAAHPYEEPAFDIYEVRSNLGFVGRIGSLAAPVPFEEFAAKCAEALGGAGLRVSGGGSVFRVAVVPGSGSEFVGPAAASQADVLVTGDVGHHRVIEALDGGLSVVDPGHAPTERPGLKALAALVGACGTEFRDLTDIDPTPWR